MPQTTSTPSSSSPDESPVRAGGLAGLKPMSTTAGVGLGEYRAINPLAVAALICGVAAGLSLLHPLLLVIPALAVVLGVVALVQIRRSHGTQSGSLLAIGGMLFAVVLGSYVLGAEYQRNRQADEYRAEIEQMFQDFGQALAQEDYQAAYALTMPAFQKVIPFEQFRDTLAGLPKVTDSQGDPLFGRPLRAHSNDLAEITVDPAEGDVHAQALLIVEFEHSEPVRQPTLLKRTPAGWRIREFGIWFPAAHISRPHSHSH